MIVIERQIDGYKRGTEQRRLGLDHEAVDLDQISQHLLGHTVADTLTDKHQLELVILWFEQICSGHKPRWALPDQTRPSRHGAQRNQKRTHQSHCQHVNEQWVRKFCHFYLRIVNFLKVCIQNSSDKDWNLLGKYFESLRPIKSHIEHDRRVAHYLERIYSYTNRTCHRDSSALILNKLADLFPHVFYIN